MLAAEGGDVLVADLETEGRFYVARVDHHVVGPERDVVREIAPRLLGRAAFGKPVLAAGVDPVVIGQMRPLLRAQGGEGRRTGVVNDHQRTFEAPLRSMVSPVVCGAIPLTRNPATAATSYAVVILPV